LFLLVLTFFLIGANVRVCVQIHLFPCYHLGLPFQHGYINVVFVQVPVVPCFLLVVLFVFMYSRFLDFSALKVKIIFEQ